MENDSNEKNVFCFLFLWYTIVECMVNNTNYNFEVNNSIILRGTNYGNVVGQAARKHYYEISNRR